MEDLWLSRNTALCPWDSSYFFAEWEAVSLYDKSGPLVHAWNIHPNGCLTGILIREISDGVVPVSYKAQAVIDRPPPSQMVSPLRQPAEPTLKEAKASNQVPTKASVSERGTPQGQGGRKSKNPFLKSPEDPCSNRFLSQEDRALFESVFRDSEPYEGAGYITGETAVYLMRHLGEGLDDEKLGQIWEESDADNNGVLDLEEFLQVIELITKAQANPPRGTRLESPPPPYAPAVRFLSQSLSSDVMKSFQEVTC